MLTLPLLQTGAGITLIFFALFAVISLAITAVSLFAVYWTYKDAQRRRMDSPELWALIVLVGNVVGIVLYLMVRE